MEILVSKDQKIWKFYGNKNQNLCGHMHSREKSPVGFPIGFSKIPWIGYLISVY